VAGHPADAGPAAGGPAPDRPAAGGPAPDRPAAGGARPVSVLLAEHEPEVAEMSARYLRRDGLRVRLVTDPDRALAELTVGPDAAAVVDLTMPGLDARRIRRALRTPVIFLVADLRAPRPRGLAARGDATGTRRWLARPFSPRQLVALVREVLAPTAAAKAGPAGTGPAGTGPAGTGPAGTGPAGTGPARTGPARTAPARAAPAGAGPARAVPAAGEPADPTARARVTPAERAAGALRLDATRRAAIARGHRVPLTATEYALLAFMMDHPGLVLSRQRLLAAVGRPGAGDRAADVHIAQLRAKIGADPRTGMIRTVRGVGYALDP